MSTHQWIGGAEAVAQVTAWVFGGTWEATDVINVTIGTRTESVVAGSTTITTIVDTVVAALNASTLPEFTEITWSRSGNSLVGTADTAGVPFTATVATTETGGGAADAQTIDGAASSTGTNSTACTGPNHADNAQNWTGAELPGNNDIVIFADSNVDCLYGLTQFASNTGITLKVFQSFTGRVGLPVYNETGGYFEYRTRYLAFAGAALVEIGNGEGAGSGRLMFNFGSAVWTCNVYNSGSPESGEEVAVFLKGTHADSELNVNKGFVGLAVYPGEASALSLLSVGYRDNQAGDAFVICGAGVTALTTIAQAGGFARTETNTTTFQMVNGEHVRLGTCTLTSAQIDGGALRYRSNGTLTTALVGSGGVLDFRQDTRARTLTNLSMYEGSALHDPLGTTTITNGIDLVRCTPGDVVLDIAPHQTLTLSAV